MKSRSNAEVEEDDKQKQKGLGDTNIVKQNESTVLKVCDFFYK